MGFAAFNLQPETRRKPRTVHVSVLVAATALVLACQGFASDNRYRVVLEDVPGADEISAGRIAAGISMLEARLAQPGQDDNGDLWSTLCAAYIIENSLESAERACARAVQIEPTHHALNNRGVLRVYKGDLAGAHQDFRRVRPANVNAYLHAIRTTNVRLVAADNFDLVNQLLKNRVSSRD